MINPVARTAVPTAPPPDFPRALAGFRDFHQGATILVCGCGTSLNELTCPERFITIGVNDVGRRFDPTYLVVLNPRNQFSGDRFRHVEQSRAQAVFTQLDLGIPHAHIVRFRLGSYGGADFSNPEVLHYTSNSPYLAVCLAVHLGARRIGLIGVDFTDDHFFGHTGKHVLAARLDQIDREYAALGRACRERGIEILNLSQHSLLTAFPKGRIEDFLQQGNVGSVEEKQCSQHRRVFFVNYRFLSCGEVFTDGLRNAARELGIQAEDAYWDDARLPAKVRDFSPDLLFVVHGRRFVQRWGGVFRSYNSAVWLLDEPYEVDDTARWSSRFNTVYINDPSTLDRHPNAHYLPVAYDPWVHQEAPGAKKHAVGFIGGYNQTRETMLLKLQNAGLLSYVVGGPWKSSQLQGLCLAGNIPASQTAILYRQTRLVVNVFRDLHHFNRQGISGWSLNPRVYEALGCGALVVSQRRPEAERAFPELPLFDGDGELVTHIRRLLQDPDTYNRLKADCRRRLAMHTYAQRLQTVLAISLAEAAQGNGQTGVVWSDPLPAAAKSSARPVHRVETGEGGAGGKTAHGKTQAENRLILRSGNSGEPALSGHSYKKIEPLSFTAMPRRNLIYHLWPVKGSVWRWNLDQLKQRIDIFNGRRIISIVHDAQSEDPATVMQYLDGHDCEFILESNDATGECITFPRMIREIASRDSNEITFYAHGKGVKYEPRVPGPVLRWAEVQYRTSLDDWLTVWKQLQQFALAGPFKRLGRYRTHHNLGDWHYCGTFFWMRHAFVFTRDCLDVPRFYGGVEAWPGIHFRENESGCLFLDTQRQAPYLEYFWRSLGDPALKRWQSNIELIPPPPDLVHPLPLDGCEGPRTEQKPAELAWWIQRLLAAGVRSLLTIGALQGGVEWHVARVFREQRRDIEITTIDVRVSPELKQTFQDARERFAQSMHLIEGASSSEEVRGALHDRYDAVFIDSDHGYRSVESDWLLARSLKARLVGFHDIVDSHWHVQNRCCVSRLWAKLRAGHDTEEQASGEWGGIGVVRLQ